MIHSLPTETVLDARERTERTTRVLFVLILIVYTIFFNLIFAVVLACLGKHVYFFIVKKFWMFNTIATAVALITGVVHFLLARKRSLNEILNQLGAIPADKRDEYHKVFINIVQEAELAAGIRPILPVVIPSAGCNAFSVEDGFHLTAIGVTEGTLVRLDRSELTAVVSHEAAHLVSGDSRLATTVSNILSIFNRLRVLFTKSKLWQVLSKTRASVFLILARPFLWFLAALGHFVTKFIYMGISRKREFLADANAVNMCKDPLSLAEAIYKISQKYRGSFDVPEGFAPLFILSPQVSWLDEKRGFLANLFSTHPPVADRLKKLMTWAKTDVIEIKQDLKIEKNLIETKEEPPKFFAHIKENWEGPFTLTQILALDTIKPSTFVCSADGDKIVRAADNEFLLQLFVRRMTNEVSKNRCPRCNVSLVEMPYEGTFTLHCSFCNGNLMKYGVLERIITRKDKVFSDEEIKNAKIWRNLQKVNIPAIDSFPNIRCPICNTQMAMVFHCMLTGVIIDRCLNKNCRAVWCDGGELEKIQILVEDAEKT
ncbi:MAG: M48 family metalloprotease [Elusimicrobia bacterium]|nr:M48 family metalloprotease [Elusimicrobiota bacterium]